MLQYKAIRCTNKINGSPKLNLFSLLGDPLHFHTFQSMHMKDDKEKLVFHKVAGNKIMPNVICWHSEVKHSMYFIHICCGSFQDEMKHRN